MPRGNPTKLTPEIQAAILPLAREPKFKANICASLGLHRDTLDEWLRRGESEDGTIYSEFAIEFRAAEADLIEESLAMIVNHERGHKGRMWFLEKRFPDQFGTRLKAEISGPNGGPVPVSVTPDALNRRLEQLLAEQDPGTADGAPTGAAGETDSGGASGIRGDD